MALADDKVYMATLDAMLIALNKKTGALVWETEIADPEFGYSETVAPTVYQDKVILGISGARRIRHPRPSSAPTTRIPAS